jgi:hypothetical protein
MNTKLALLTIAMVMATMASATIMTSSEQAFAKKGEADNHISEQGREHMSPNGATHSGVSQGIP